MIWRAWFPYFDFDDRIFVGKRKRNRNWTKCISLKFYLSVIMNRLNENKGQADGAIMQLSYFDNNGELEIKKKK